MPRIRSVHPDICLSDTMAALPAELERTFVRLWTHCDDEGRCEDRPKLIKAAIYPLHDTVTASVLDAQLGDLEAAGLIHRYETAGQRVIQVRSWEEYQHPQKPKESTLPVFVPEVSANGNGRVRELSGTSKEKVGTGVGVGVGVGNRRRSTEPRSRTRKAEAIADERDDVERLCTILSSSLRKRGLRNQTASVSSAWRDAARLLLDRDGVAFDEAKAVLKWAIEDEFWSQNILSMPTFRKQFDKLKAKWQVTQPEPEEENRMKRR